ncbi:MAG: CdaR family protein [Bacteroidetes bacterium]|nr:CdaR family protein [Bacteroidota bacterium]
MKSFFFKTNNSNLKGNAQLNRRVITFMFCLLISIFIWLLMSLSKEYSISVSFPVKYINLPNDKLITNHLPENISVEIKATGFNLLDYKLRQNRNTLLIDIKNASPISVRNNYYVDCNDQLDVITGQLTNAIKVVSVNPDTIFISYNKKISKLVPVKTNISMDFDEQYQLTDSILINPRFIYVFGTSEALEKISFVETVPIKLKKISGTIDLKLELNRPIANKQIEYSQNTIQARVNVTKYTEALMELPIEVENLPLGLNLKTFPDKITVKYQVAFDDYGKISSSDFKLVVDYSKIDPGSNKLKVQLVKSPAKVRVIKFSNEKVEFIIRK